MKKIVKTLAALLLTIGFTTAQAEVNYQVIPLPKSIELAPKGGVFTLPQGSIVTYTAGNEQMESNARLLCHYLQQDAAFSLLPEPAVKKGAAITLALGLKSENPDAYTINVSKKGITITGATESGVFRGIQTLRKAIGTEGGESIELPYVTIQDEPRFQYRGTMLDCARHFFPVEFVKKYIDILALHGVNNFHWHITDDQGWRFEVKAIPALTEKASIRRETVIGHNCGIYDGQEYGRGGYYTQEQCREIVRYAAERYINVIPEIDLPGHMVAALSVRPDLGCTGGPYEVLPYWGVANDVLCAGNPETLKFLKTVLSELADVFPSKQIHIGGDESPRVRWQHCAKCQAKMKELGLQKEAQLQTYINKELETFLAQKGKEIIGWDETLEGGLSDNSIVMSWRGYEGGIAAARQHHRVIMSPTGNCYIDYYQLQNQSAQPMAIGGYLPLSKVYSMEPIPSELTADEAKYILGPQVNLWTEYVGAPQHAEYMLLPRLAAMAEVQWMQPAQKDFKQFSEDRLPRMQQLYKKLDYKYCTRFE